MEIHFTEREMDIMAVLWERGPSTVAEVRDALSDELAYTTVSTMLKILEEKGHVEHRQEGKAHRFFPRVNRAAAGRSAVRKLVRKVFGGSPELLMTQLVEDRDLSDDDLQKLRRLLDERLTRRAER